MASPHITGAWQAPSTCPTRSKVAIEGFVNARIPPWRNPPVTGEVFDSFERCRERLRVYALTQGFAVVIKRVGKSNSSKEYGCIHHGDKTRNDRGLEDRVTQDEQGDIISTRKRESTRVMMQKSCLWNVVCSYKDVPKRGSGVKGYTLIVKELAHSHPLTHDPLIYSLNQSLVQLQTGSKSRNKRQLDEEIHHNDDQLHPSAQQLTTQQITPSQPPDPIPKRRTAKKKKTNVLDDARGLTGSEVAQRDIRHRWPEQGTAGATNQPPLPAAPAALDFQQPQGQYIGGWTYYGQPPPPGPGR